MSAADIFRSLNPFSTQGGPQGPQQQGPQGTQFQPGNPGTTPQQHNQANLQNLPDGSISQLENQQAQGDKTGQIQQQGKEQQGVKEPSPLDAFAKLFDNTTNAAARPSLNADPAKIEAVAKTVDFTKGLNPELARKALAGDQAAFFQILNDVAQKGFAVAIQASSHLVDKQSGSAIDYMNQSLPNQIRTFQSRDAMMTENPAFSHPAAQPLLAVIQDRLATQFPTATSAELTQYAKKYFQGVLEVFNPANGAAGKGKGDSQGNEADGGILSTMQQRMQAQNQFDWNTWADAEASQQQGR